MTPEDRQEVVAMIAKAIRSHEVRVAWASGIAGLLILAGIFHAIWLVR